jgi:endonuclease YncB( thermonuclease family)
MPGKEKVIKIIDGDTFLTDGRKKPVHIANVDAPELGTPGAAYAKAALTKMILGKEVLIDTR